MAEELTHNPRNAVTHAIERVDHNGQSAVRKVLNGHNRADTPPEWKASDFRACAVKYVWLGPLMLEQAGESIQREYGGCQLEDANRQYRNRGLTLSYLCNWAKLAVTGPQNPNPAEI